MIRKLLVETWDKKSKVLAELDVVKELSPDRVIVNVFANYYKELEFRPEEGCWVVCREAIDYEREK